MVRPHQARVGPAHLGGQLVAMPPQDDAVGSEEAARNAASDQTKRRQPLRKQAGLGRRAAAPAAAAVQLRLTPAGPGAGRRARPASTASQSRR